jgi:hypothetical protein
MDGRYVDNWDIVFFIRFTLKLIIYSVFIWFILQLIIFSLVFIWFILQLIVFSLVFTWYILQLIIFNVTILLAQQHRLQIPLPAADWISGPFILSIK